MIPERKLPGDEGRIIASPRIGEPAPPRERELRPVAPDLRRRICLNGPCAEAPVQPPPPESDLRRRVCLNGPCLECPAGQSAGKDGKCVATTPPTTTSSDQCQPNQTWNGAVCVNHAQTQCRPDEFWNGIRCETRADECASINARAALLAHEVRTAKMGMQGACSNNPSGQQCSDLKQSYDLVLQRYRMLMNEAPIACRAMLPDPLAL